MNYIVQLLAELLKGAMLAIGLFAGIMFIITMLYKLYQKKKGNDRYEASDLLIPFKNYLQKAHREEWFEQIKEIEGIIDELEKGNVPILIAFYKIKTEPEIYMESKTEGRTVIKVGKKYDVLSRIIDIKNKP